MYNAILLATYMEAILVDGLRAAEAALRPEAGLRPPMGLTLRLDALLLVSCAESPPTFNGRGDTLV